MNKLRVGIVIPQNRLPTAGGTFSYTQTLLEGLNKFEFDDKIEIVNIIFSSSTTHSFKTNKEVLHYRVNGKSTIKQHARKHNIKGSVLKFFAYLSLVKGIYTLFKERQDNKIISFLQQNNIDILYYLEPFGRVFDYPFIINHWDVAHKSMFPFPEIVQDQEGREQFYLQLLNKAIFVLCESNAGINELKKYYHYNENKLKLFPIFASKIINLNVTQEKQDKILLSFKLKKVNYLLYPAQFWPQKNHYNLLIAFKQFIEISKNETLQLILPGSDKGNMNYIKNVAEQLNLQNRVLIPGFISDEELYTLYKNALCLVMPTFLGPTNMPLIEAAHIGCNVLCSDLAGHKEIMGDAATYFAPQDAETICNAIVNITTQFHSLSGKNKIQEHILSSEFIIEKSLSKLNNYLLEIMPYRKAWDITY